MQPNIFIIVHYLFNMTIWEKMYWNIFFGMTKKSKLQAILSNGFLKIQITENH